MVSQLRPRQNLQIARKLPTVPASWKQRGGSEVEYFAYVGLLANGYREGGGPKGFTYQASLDGDKLRKRGDVIPDFLLNVPRLAINVQSRYYHSATADQRAQDQYVRAVMEQQGIRMAFISEDQARQNAKFFISRAIAGLESGPLGVLE